MTEHLKDKPPAESHASETSATGGLSAENLERFGPPATWTWWTCVRLTMAWAQARPLLCLVHLVASCLLVGMATIGFWFVLALPLMCMVYVWAAASARSFLIDTSRPREAPASTFGFLGSWLLPGFFMGLVLMACMVLALVIGIQPATFWFLGLLSSVAFAITWLAISVLPLEIALFGGSFEQALLLLRAMLWLRPGAAATVVLFGAGAHLVSMAATAWIALTFVNHSGLPEDTLALVGPLIPCVLVGVAKAWSWTFCAFAFFRLRGSAVAE